MHACGYTLILTCCNFSVYYSYLIKIILILDYCVNTYLVLRKCFGSTRRLFSLTNLILPMMMIGCSHHHRQCQDAAKQRSILISSIGQKAYKILRNLVAPEKPTDASFKNFRHEELGTGNDQLYLLFITW